MVVPVCLTVGWLAWRDHPAAPVLALARAIFAMYTYSQLILGNEYLHRPGNIERFFSLLLAMFLLAATRDSAESRVESRVVGPPPVRTRDGEALRASRLGQKYSSKVQQRGHSSAIRRVPQCCARVLNARWRQPRSWFRTKRPQVQILSPRLS